MRNFDFKKFTELFLEVSLSILGQMEYFWNVKDHKHISSGRNSEIVPAYIANCSSVECLSLQVERYAVTIIPGNHCRNWLNSKRNAPFFSLCHSWCVDGHCLLSALFPNFMPKPSGNASKKKLLCALNVSHIKSYQIMQITLLYLFTLNTNCLEKNYFLWKLSIRWSKNKGYFSKAII